MILKRNLLFLTLLFICVGSFAQIQLLDSLSLEQADEYTSIDSALKDSSKVIKLVLRKNKLKAFPKEIFRFPNLQYLDLSKNKITEIPSEIASLKNLQKLVLAKNNIEYLPQEIGMLQNLKVLIVNQNNLAYIPSQIGSLESLVYLDLWSNNISTLPMEISKLKKLNELDLRIIQISDAEQDKIKSYLPRTTIHFSPSCKCGQ